MYVSDSLLSSDDLSLPSDSSCPVCACAMDDGESLHICDDCETPHHSDCWDYSGGCAIFGCRKGALRKFEAGRRRAHLLTKFSLTLMSIWGKVLSVDFGLCLLAHYGLFFLWLELVAGSFIGLGMIASSGFASFVNLLLPGMHLPLYFASGSFLLLIFAVGGLCITSILTNLMSIHFWIAGLSMSSGRMDTAIKIASRVEQPESLLRFSNSSFSVGRFISMSLWKFFKVVSVMLLLVGLLYLQSFPYIIGVFLSFLVLYGLCFNYIPPLEEEMGRKLSFISAFQNRLIATAKKSKG